MDLYKNNGEDHYLSLKICICIETIDRFGPISSSSQFYCFKFSLLCVFCFCLRASEIWVVNIYYIHVSFSVISLNIFSRSGSEIMLYAGPGSDMKIWLYGF